MTKSSIKLLFTGDISFDEYTYDFYKKNIFSDDLKNVINTADYSILNFESPITNIEKTDKMSLYHKSNPECLKFIKENFKRPVLSLANNHMLDYGRDGLTDTINILKKNKISFIGAGNTKEEAIKAFIIENDFKIGIISFQYNKSFEPLKGENGVLSDSSKSIIKKAIKDLRKKCDYVVVMYHGGYEFVNAPFPYIRKMLKKYVDYGADVIVGHHPHVVQGYEIYKQKPIFYSLGNFIFDTDFQRCQNNTADELVLMLEFNKECMTYQAIGIDYNREKELYDIKEPSEFYVKYNDNIYNKIINNEVHKVNLIRRKKRQLSRKNKISKLGNINIYESRKLNIIPFEQLFSEHYKGELLPFEVKVAKKKSKIAKKIAKIKNTKKADLLKKIDVYLLKIRNYEIRKLKFDRIYHKFYRFVRKIWYGTKKEQMMEKNRLKRVNIFNDMPILSLNQICEIARIDVPDDKDINDKYKLLLIGFNNISWLDKDYYYRRKFTSEVRKFCIRYNSQHNLESKDKLSHLISWLYKYGKMGFTKHDYFDYEVYKKDDKVLGKFLNGRYRDLVLRECNKDKSSYKIFKNKGLFNETFSDYVKRDWVNARKCTFEEFQEFINKHPVHFVKPIEGTGGAGAHKCDSTDMNIENLYNEYRRKKYIAEEIIIQHPQMAQFNESTLNTVRMYSLLCTDGNVLITLANIRIGRSGRDVDNFHEGGITCELDEKTGKILTYAIDRNHSLYKEHPDSKISLLDFEVPLWKEAVKAVSESAKKIPGVRHVGWDVSFTLKNTIELVEGNYWPNFDVTQAASQTGKKDHYEKEINKIIQLNNSIKNINNIEK